MPLKKDKPFPKRPRLKHFEYAGYYAYFITILTKERNRYLKKTDIVEPIITIMKDTAEKEMVSVDAFCFMPDHVHLLLRGADEDADVKKFMKLFKQKSGYWFKQRFQRSLWHLSYYDHVLRKDEDIRETVMYILNNPVRKGIVSDYKEYSFNGSFTLDITCL